MAELNNTLFSDQELDDMSGGLFSATEEKGPVTVLGKTFANDDERRAYFREELRKKLPELKLIEGFPIGSDDDIVNLSDPPFYTACPNPWLNDFIAEWDADKNTLYSEGKRESVDTLVSEPYANDISEGKNNPIYLAHSYHTKVPHTAIMRYLLHYTEPGDVVFDGFCGTGMTGVAANKCASKYDVDSLNVEGAKVGARHAICSDLAPIASLISGSYNLRHDFKKFKNDALAILAQVEKELGWMFETRVNGHPAKINCTIWSDVYSCPNCGSEIVLWDSAVNIENETIADEFACPHCGTTCSKKNLTKVWDTNFDTTLNSPVRIIKKVPVRVNYTFNGKRGECNASDFDYELFEKISALDTSKLRTDALPVGEKTTSIERSNGITHSHLFYSKRTFIYLSRVLELAGDNTLLRNWFTSVCQSTSMMNKFRFSGTGIMTGTFFFPSLCREYNPYNSLLSKLNDFCGIDYEGRGNSVVSLLSATDLSTISDKSIDYIFVDPPFGSNIMYSELSSIWEGWLRVKTNNSPEAIINKVQEKGLFDYQGLMNRSFREFYRILKPNKWLTMEFSNTSASVWNSIQNALQGVGFIVANVAAIDKQQGSFNAVTTTTAVKQDLVISCFKPSDELTMAIDSGQGAASGIWDFIDEYLEHLPIHIKKNHSTTVVIERSPKILYDRLITYYVQKGYPVPIDAHAFQSGLNERYILRDGMFFTSIQAAQYEEKKKETPDFIPMGLIVSNEADGIEWLKIHLDKPKTYAEIQPEWMQAINGIRKNDILPELSVLLDENFIQEEDGKWRLPNIQDDVDKALLRTKALLKEFKLYVEQASKPKAKIKEVRVEAVRAGFKQCYIDKDFQTIVTVGDKIPQNLLEEDEILLQFYDIAVNHV